MLNIRVLPFDELQREVNETYYKRRGRKLYSDFKTFGSSEKIAHANAIDFYRMLADGELDCGSEITVYDFGIGNGLFSRFFLEKFYGLDGRKREFIPRLHYSICDISEELVKKAETEMNRSGFEVEGIVCNALGPLSFLKGASYMRSNEMYDDLPAKIFLKSENGKICEVLMNERMEKEYAPSREKNIRKIMEEMPEGYEIPINYGARKHLEKCVSGLKKNGYVDIFDYGFGTVGEIAEFPKEIWNNSIVREFNSQLTVDVNFIHLTHGLGSRQIIQPQKGYAEKALGERLYYAEMEQLYYFNERELKANRKKMKKFGYPEDYGKGGSTSESDDYLHLRVWK